MVQVDYGAAILNLMQTNGANAAASTASAQGGDANAPGLKVIQVVTTEPAPYTFTFEGTAHALDMDLFEIPVNCYPLVPGDRLLVLPMVGTTDSMRWGAITKLNGGVTIATMTGENSLQVEGIGRQYTADDLYVPPFVAVESIDVSTIGGPALQGTKVNIRPLQAGDVVSIAPTGTVGNIKYAILERY